VQKHRIGHKATSPSPSARAVAQGSPDSVQADTTVDTWTEEARVCARRMRWTRREGGMSGVAGEGGKHDDSGKMPRGRG
jgi:hypothetical protein